jgi:hypothetical protein
MRKMTLGRIVITEHVLGDAGAPGVDFIFPCPLRSIAMSLAKSAYLAGFTGNNQ